MKKKKILIGALLASAVIGVSACSADVTPTEIPSNTTPEVIKKTVSFNSQGGSGVLSVSVILGNKVSCPNNPEKTGYTFGGWYKESTCENEWNFETEIVSDNITLYAKWIAKEVPAPAPEEKYSVTYSINGHGEQPEVVADVKNLPSELPVLTDEGYSFIGWYLNEELTEEAQSGAAITANTTLYAKWVESVYTVTFKGTSLSTVEVKHGAMVEKPSDPIKAGYKFVGWYADNGYTTVFDFNSSITSDTTIYALFKQESSSSDIDDKENGSGEVTTKGDVEIVSASGAMESAYVTFKKLNDIKEYDYYLKSSTGEFSLVDEKIAYSRVLSSSTIRVDFMGLQAGSYEVMILPHGSTTAEGSIASLNVISYDRSGYAHFNYSSGVGAYNDNGTLKDNAIVLYVTDENKNTIELSYKGTTVKGIGNILNSVGAEAERGLTSNGGEANTNQGIIEKLGKDNIPLVIRFVGCVSNTGLYQKGTYNAANKPLIDGLTIYDSYNNGGTPGDNGHMARIRSGKDITLEGIGSDATIDGWGFHFMASSSAPNLGKSFEVRNLTFINTPEDAIGMEGVQESKDANSKISASVERCWIHNNEFYGPSILNPAESDKSEGDGSCDFKRGQYLTVSYNYFEGCHKTNLVGSADYSLQFNLTYHHNYWKLCKARGPLTRRANVHMYNNVFEGQTDYAINTRADAYIVSESNLFYMCKNPFRVDGGAIKSYNDSVSSAIYQKGGATFVNDKAEVVANNCAYNAGGIDYSKFDTNPEQSYIATGNYDIQTNITDARKVIAAYCGVRKDKSIAPKDVTMSDISYLPQNVTPNKVSAYPSTVTPGKISKTVYAFTIDKAAIVTISYSSDEFTTTGVLVNEAGQCLLTASGSTILTPGTYMIQPVSFQPGDSGKLTNGTFKEVTINSIKFEEYNSKELNQALIDNYNSAVENIPSTIKYDDTTLAALKRAKDAYNALTDELKETVSYSKVEAAYSEYLSLGKTYVEGLINSIGEVNENSGDAISAARTAYNSLRELDNNIQIANYNVLTKAEDDFDSYALTYCINCINNIGSVTLESENLITAARAAYNALDDEEKGLVTNYKLLTEAEGKYAALVSAADVNTDLNDIDLTSLADMKALIAKYNALSALAKEYVDVVKLSNAKTSYLVKLIDSIGTVSSSSAGTINEALALYDSLNTSEKEIITNYQNLVSAKEAYDKIAAQAHTMTFENGVVDSTGYYTITNGNLNKKVTKEYDGITYTTGLKIESKTEIVFNAGASSKLKLVTDGASKKIKINGNEYTTDSNGILIVDLPEGEVKITKKDQVNVFLISVE